VQRTQCRARADGALGLPRALARLLKIKVHERIQPLVVRLDPPDRGIHDLDRREFPAPDPPG
jgi:hypothetical protein